MNQTIPIQWGAYPQKAVKIYNSMFEISIHEDLLSAVVTEKTPVHQPVVQIYYDTYYEHLHRDQDVFAGVQVS